MSYVLSNPAVCTAATLVLSSPCHVTKGTCQASIRVRHFFYHDSSRERTIFAERLSDVASCAHKTERLQEALVLVGFALGGRAEARLVQDRGSSATPTHAALRCAVDPLTPYG